MSCDIGDTRNLCLLVGICDRQAPIITFDQDCTDAGCRSSEQHTCLTSYCHRYTKQGLVIRGFQSVGTTDSARPHGSSAADSTSGAATSGAAGSCLSLHPSLQSSNLATETEHHLRVGCLLMAHLAFICSMAVASAKSGSHT